MAGPLRTLVVGCGHMGVSHARAYHGMPDAFTIVGLVSRGDSRSRLNADLGGGCAEYADFHVALAQAKPDVVCISTYTETHAGYAIAAMEAGAHVFVEKPLAATVADAEAVVATARRLDRALVVGYILGVHPAWMAFTAMARELGTPLVLRMNLNQQSAGAHWDTHRLLLRDTSPIVDCGVHYVDVMCQMTGARPVAGSGISARLSGDLAPGQVNYGHLQVTFDDGSVGWYEAGWGPMMSETAYFVKDVIGPRGSVSIVARETAGDGASADIGGHTRVDVIRRHHAETGADGRFARPDEIVAIDDAPGHDELCRREQLLLLDAIHGRLDLSAHWQRACDSLRIVLAADESARTHRTVAL